MYRVQKRNGSFMDFDIRKIANAMTKAFAACDQPVDESVIEMLALRVTSDFAPKIKDNIISVEDIQDSVESILAQAGYMDVAKAYILYRDHHAKARNAGEDMLNYKKVVDGYLKIDDWRVKENSTVTYSIGGLILSNSGAITANYWLNEIYDKEIGEAHKNVDMHIHDLSMLSPYCFTGETRVKTLDGKNYSFKEMVDANMKEVWVFAFDGEKIVPAKAINPRITRRVNQLVKITLTNKQTILVTPDHLFMVRDGSYVPAKDLTPNTSLMPLYVADNPNTKYSTISQVWYEGRGDGYLHRWVAESVLGRALLPNEVVHHLDGDKHNCSPENLQVMDDAEHRRLSVLETMQTDKWKEANHARLVAYNQSEGKRQSVSAFAQTRSRSPQGTFTKFAYCGEGAGTPDYNHCVRKVEVVKLTEYIDVYDMTVPQYENFALNAGVFVHNCAGWSLKQLIEKGIGGVPSKITSAPAAHLSTLVNQMVNFLGIMQNEWAGAQAFSSFDTHLAPFVKADNLSYKEVKQCIQSFVYGVNTPSRWGTQSPFTNITLDWTVPADMAELNCIVGGKEMPFRYKDCKNEMDMINKAFLEIMIEGDAAGRGFSYPIPTYSITKDFDWSNTENNRLLFEMTAKYGTPYFSNYINSDMDPSDVRSMCPLRGDQKVLVYDDFSQNWHISTVEYLFKGGKAVKEYTILLNGEAKRARLNRFDNLDFYKVRTVNGHEVIFSHNHANLVLGGAIKQTHELTTDDYLPFTTKPYAGNNSLSYEDGLLVGAYMGDGSLKGDYAVVYSVNDTTKQDIMNQIIHIGTTKFGAKCKVDSVNDGSCLNVTLTSKILRGLIEEFVSGTALTKELNAKCINHSIAFRQGIVDGLMATDGSPSARRIYTASKAAVTSLTTLFASLGYPTRVTADTRTASDGKLSDSVVYCVRNYSPNGPQRVRDVYVKDADYTWFRIESVEKIQGGSKIGYCFEVLDDDEPYFMLPCGMVTHNCRLRLDLRELRRKAGGFFGSGDSTGSVGVVTLNIPRLAYLASDEEDFYNRLDKLMDIAARSLKLKRTALTKFLEAGLYPYAKEYLGTFENHFSTLGLAGVNEACLNAKWLRCTIADAKGKQFAIDILNHMRERLSDYQEMYGDLYNLEATPAESTAYRFAMHDKRRYPDIITAGSDENPYYTNSTNLPVGYTDDIFEALDHQDDLHVLYTSGTVFHAFQGEKLPSWEAAAALVRKIAENYKLPYFSMSPTYSICKNHGYLHGEQYRCPDCGEDTEVYSRITGYYRPVQNWNNGKAQEFKDRKTYTPFKTADDTCESCHFPDPLLDSADVKLDAYAEEDTSNACHNNIADAKAECCECEPNDSCECDCHNNGLFLVATKVCPKCKQASLMLDAANIAYTKVYAEDDMEWVQRFNLTQAPVLIKIDGQDVTRYANLSEIRKFIENKA